MSDCSKPVFLLGLGAQKAGTTWLHAYIAHRPEVDTGLFKEYHIWDGITVPAFSGFDKRSKHLPLRTKRNLLRNLRDVRNKVMRRQRERFFFRRDLQRNPERYFDYFAALLAHDGIQISSDITPSYSALDVETLSRIRDGFEQRGITTKALFLMRDPVDRCLSAIRMYRRKGVSKQGVDISLSDEQALRSYVASSEAQLRTNYHHTLRAMDAAFPAENIYVGAYETMFSNTEIKRISDFIGIDVDYGFINNKFNTTEKSCEIRSEAVNEAANVFLPVYEYCFSRYSYLRDYWNDPDLLASQGK